MSEDEVSNINMQCFMQILKNQRFLLQLSVGSNLSRSLIKERDVQIEDTTELIQEILERP